MLTVNSLMNRFILRDFFRACAIAEGWNQEKSVVDFYDAKGVVENLLEALNISGLTFDGEEC